MFPFPSKKKPVKPSISDPLIEKWEASYDEITMRHQQALRQQNLQSYYAALQQAAAQTQQMTQQTAYQKMAHASIFDQMYTAPIDVDALVRERDELKEENSSLRRMIEARAVVVEE